MTDLRAAEVATLKAHIEHAPDWFLQILVDMVNNETVRGIPVTLHVGGAIVAGTLIGWRDYFEDLGGQFGAALGVSGDEPARSFLELASAKSQGAESEASDSPLVVTTYIHLRNARTLVNGQNVRVNFQGLLWRGRLSAVSGFTLGEPTVERE